MTDQEIIEKSIDDYKVPEDSYKADSEACDRYISFSSELLRLSLIAIGGYGTLVTIFLKDKPEKLPALQNSWGLFVSVCLFCICAGCTLVHRFYATDSMGWYIEYLRATISGNNANKIKQHKGLHRKLDVSEWSLIAAEYVFAAAVIFFIAGFYQLLHAYTR